VARGAHLRTAWSDKHPAYDLVNGPSGHGVEDLYTPEIAPVATNGPATAPYDDLKVAAILHEIDGYDHTGKHKVGVPAVFGMNFQDVSVAQKDTAGGYRPNRAPSPELATALAHTDASVGRFVTELGRRHLLGSTDVIVTAKHGQSPIAPRKLKIINPAVVPGIVNAVKPGRGGGGPRALRGRLPNLVAQATEDDVALLWLTDQSKTAAAAKALQAHATEAGISQVLWGKPPAARFGDPRHDSRTPDIIVITKPGVIYTKPGKKVAEHGGFCADDTHVALVAAGPGFRRADVTRQVQTTQIAPTIPALLGLNPNALQSVRLEDTHLLPR
jgi:predicted AlkP superfamily pyrophosphatase or phosphodiesterase